MASLSLKIKNEYGKAYVFENVRKKLFSTPKIYNAANNMEVRWYVYFSYRNPVTGRLEKQTPIYSSVNSFHTIKERTKAIMILRNTVHQILKDGFNPYQDNDKKYYVDDKVYSFNEAIEFTLKIKEKMLKKSSYQDFRIRILNFQKFIKKIYFDEKNVILITKKMVMAYLNSILETSSPRNRNNARSCISMFFQTLEENDIIKDNFVKKINILKSDPVKNKSYSTGQEQTIFEYLEKNDKTLLLFIQLISYNCLRPIEIVRLKVKDIDTIDKILKVETKTDTNKTKLIPQIMLDNLPDLSQFDGDLFLITPDGVGGTWEANEINRRNYFSKRFLKVKKALGLSKEYGLYSFRHTFITKLYNNLVQNSTPFEAKSKLMLITGHSTMVALDKYLRDIDAVLPEDYSNNFE